MSGQAEVVQRVQGGESWLASLHTGDIAGELSFIDGGPASTTVHLVEESHVLFLTREEFSQVIRRNEHIRVVLLKVIADRNRHALRARVESVEPTLMRVARSLESIESGTRRGYARQNQLAVELGVSRATVTRTLAVLRDQGIVTTRRGEIVIRDREGLRALIAGWDGGRR